MEIKYLKTNLRDNIFHLLLDHLFVISKPHSQDSNKILIANWNSKTIKSLQQIAKT